MILISLLHMLRGQQQEPQQPMACGVRSVYPDGWHVMNEQQRFAVTASAIETHYQTLPALDKLEVVAQNFLQWKSKRR